MSLRSQILVVAITALSCLSPLQSINASEPTTAPLLRFNTYMHYNSITGITTDLSNRLLATSSRDKTIKIWETSTGKLIKTIYPPIEALDEGKLEAIAMSPDGKTVAVGGFTGNSWRAGYSVYIFDTSSGEMNGHVDGLPSYITRLAYSPDGSQLAIGTGRGASLYNTLTLENVWHDYSFNSDCYAVSYTHLTLPTIYSV